MRPSLSHVPRSDFMRTLRSDFLPVFRSAFLPGFRSAFLPGFRSAFPPAHLLRAVFAWPLIAAALMAATVSGAPASAAPDFSSRRFLDAIKHSREDYFDRTVAFYDSLLARKPDPLVFLEKCRFMESALYDPETEENPRYEEWQACKEELEEAWPDDIHVNLYKLEGAYGDSAIALAEALERRCFLREVVAEDSSRALIFAALARHYSYQDSARQAIEAAKAALRYDPASKVHFTMGQQYAALGMRIKARTVFLEAKDVLSSWEKRDAAGQLVELGYPADALVLYREAMQDTSVTYFDYSDVATAFERTGQPDSARAYMQKVNLDTYNADDMARKLFDFDLRNSPGRQALESYRAMRDHGYATDPFSFHRLRLFASHPWLPVQPRELVGLFMILVVVVVALAAPYLWILPLHFAGPRLFRNRPPLETPFSMQHLWLAGSGTLLAAFFALGLFQPDSLNGSFSDSFTPAAASDPENAWFFATFCILMSALSLAFLFRTRTWGLFRHRGSVAGTAGALLGGLVLLYFVRKANFLLFPDVLKEASRELGNGSIISLISSTLRSFGLGSTLFLAAVLVPLYEEFLFRGIGMGALERRFPFWAANSLQAAGFALAHDAIQLFPFFFTMGVVAGWMYRRTGSLFGPVLLHAVNNAMAIWAIWALVKMQAAM